MVQVENILYQEEYIIMNGREVFKFAVRKWVKAALMLLKKLD